MTGSKRTKISVATIGALAVTSLAVAMNQAGAQSEEALRVATYQPQEAFQMYHRTAEFQQKMQELQAQAEQTDPEEVAQLQQEAEAMQQEVVEHFDRDVENAVEGIAEEEGVKIVAMEVVYSADEVEVEDVTGEVVDQINEGAEQPAQEDALPPLPE